MNIFKSIMTLAIAGAVPLLADTSSAINLDFKEPEIVADPTIKEPVGMSINNPVVFEKIKKYNALKFAQSEYIRKHYEGYRVTVDVITLNPKGRLIQGLGLEQEGEKPVMVYFDVDDIYRKTKKIEDKGLQKRVEELLKEQRDN